ncbi:MAG TPA: histidine kinase [Cyanobacteria bacterium UBA11162]|nr:histidine kinase [Cyanobacteria bacterium UBA11162]
MLSNLKLAPKFTLFLSIVFIIGIIISGVTLSQLTQRRAEADVAYKSRILMQMTDSIRNYTSSQVSPLLTPKLETEKEFLPQTIPTYSAREVFEAIRQKPEYKNYLYKDAVLNPSNPRDLANEFETELVEEFRNESNLEEIDDFITIEGEKLFYSARPIIIKDQSCLRCHSTPEAAPKSLIKTYGSENGFNWQLNEILGVQIIYVPSQEVFKIAHQLSGFAIVIFIAIFAIVILLINFLLKRTVIQPIRPMARLAQKISSDELSADKTTEPDLENLGKVAGNSDELGQLARIFQQMADAIYARNQNFTQQLEELSIKSEEMNIRSSAKTSKVAYFKALQKKAKAIRDRLTEATDIKSS